MKVVLLHMQLFVIMVRLVFVFCFILWGSGFHGGQGEFFERKPSGFEGVASSLNLTVSVLNFGFHAVPSDLGLKYLASRQETEVRVLLFRFQNHLRIIDGFSEMSDLKLKDPRFCFLDPHLGNKIKLSFQRLVNGKNLLNIRLNSIEQIFGHAQFTLKL